MRILLIADPPAAERFAAHLREHGAEVEVQISARVHSVHANTSYVLAMNLGPDRDHILASAARVGATVIRVPSSWTAAASGVLKPVLDRLSVEATVRSKLSAGETLQHRPMADLRERLALVRDLAPAAKPEKAPEVVAAAPPPAPAPAPEAPASGHARTRALAWLRSGANAEASALDGFARYSESDPAPVHSVTFRALRHFVRSERGLPNDGAWWGGVSRSAARYVDARAMLDENVAIPTQRLNEMIRERHGLGLSRVTIDRMRKAAERRHRKQQTNPVAAPPPKESDVAQVETTRKGAAAGDLASIVELAAPMMRDLRVRWLKLTLDPDTGKVRAEWEIIATGSVEV